MRHSSYTFVMQAARASIYGVIPLLVLAAMIMQLNPSGIRSFRYSVGKPSALISQFFPGQRLTMPQDGKQQVKQEPVYVWVRYPHRYDSAEVHVAIDNPSGRMWKVGIATASTPMWAYSLAVPDSNGDAVFELSKAYVDHGRLRFIISIPGLEADNDVALKGFDIRLQRESLLQTLQRRLLQK